jgi:saccharopine dehydrogenase (NADP+, L-glutamate forming)
MFRGTLRNPGWCDSLRAIARMGWLDEEPVEGIEGWTFGQLTSRLLGSTRVGPGDPAAEPEVAANLKWLGLLGDDPLPPGPRAPVDILTARMLERMSYAPGERDMLVLQHEFLAAYPNRQEKITSTMVDFGIPGGDSSMSRTVGLPAAIGVRLILEGKIHLTGVQIPVVPEIYEPVLEELEALGIRFRERWETA